MHAKDLMKLNNEKRALLNEENEDQYGSMLFYLRANLTKSAQETEEILIELLDHLLAAQDEGKTAKEIFGDNLLAYCDEIIGELPREKMIDSILMFTWIGFIFLATLLISDSILDLILRMLGKSEWDITLSIGKTLILFPVLIITAVALIYFILKWISKGLFKKMAKGNMFLEFIFVCFIGATIATPVIVGSIFIPSIGTEITISKLYTLLIGIAFVLFSIILKMFRMKK